MRTPRALPVAGLALAALAASALCAAARAQQRPAVTVGRNVHVSAAQARYAMREVALAAHPTDPARLLGCGMVEAADEERYWTVVYLSTDGGKSWSPVLETKRPDFSIDPACTFGVGDLAHYAAIARGRPGPTVLALWRSVDGGRTWEEQAPLPMRRQSIDQEWLVPDATGGKFHGRVYMAAATSIRAAVGSDVNGVAVWISTDSGKTFDGPTVRLLPVGHDALGVANAVLMSDGTLVTLIGEIKPVGRSKPGAPNAALSVFRSTDGGETLGRSIKLDDYYEAQPVALASVSPRLAVDPGSAAFKDRLYATWTDERSGRFEIYLSYSADQGRTWSRPVVISDDPPYSDGRRPNHFMPTVAVNKDGVVGVSWYDRREHPDNLGWHVRFRASLDGGETWLPSIRVSTASNDITDRTALYTQAYARGGGSGGYGRSAPPEAGPLVVEVSIQGSNYSAGDYAGLAAAADGVFHAFWVDNRTGLPQIWTAPITVRGVAAARAGAESRRAPVDSPRVAREPGRPGELTDVSSKVTLLLTNSAFDRATNTVSVVARLGNVSRDTLAGPFQGRVTEITSQLARRAELIGGASGTGSGAVIDFADVVPGGVLAPGQRSEPKRLVFRLSELRPLREGDEYRLDLVSMKVSVYGRVGGARR
ncbi:MAG: glycoside hydrolase [Gemmatimonadota bacterium]|nr:glycoside hydrolase [Gemmatimonadota bacterium]